MKIKYILIHVFQSTIDSFMRHKTFLVIVLMIFLFTLDSLIANDKFEKHFLKIKTIQLSSEELLVEIASLDIDETGNFLITDVIGKQVLIFDESGKFIKKLSTEPCHPGFNFAPIKAKYSPSKTILMMNAGPWGFRFKNNGECLGGMNKTFLASINFCFDKSGNIIAEYKHINESYLCKMDSLGKEIKRFGNFPKNFKNLLYRMEGGGIVCDQNGFIYHANAIEPKIYKYNKDLKLVATFTNEPSYYKRISTDLKSGKNSQGLLSEFNKVMKEKTSIYGLYLLYYDKLMIQYITSGICGVDIFDLNGKLLVTDVVVPGAIIYAKDGKVYIDREPELKDDELANPSIEVYQFKY